MTGRRVRTTAAVLSAVAGILAGILGGWLVGRWAWGVAAAVLTLIAVVAGGEVIKARAEEGENTPHSEGRAGDRIIAMTVADHATVTASVIATGDVDQSRTTHISRGTPVPAAVAICAVAVIAVAGGTVYFSHQPEHDRGGASPRHHSAFRDSGPTARTAPGNALSSPGATSTSAAAGPVAATIHEADSGGDSITQTVSFGTPVPLTQFSLVENAVAGGICGTLPPGPAARDLAVPVTIVSVLNSSIPAQANVSMSTGQFWDNSGNSNGLLDSTTIGDFTDGPQCEYGGETVSLNREGVPVTFHAWLVFSGAITPNHPHGDMTALGQTYAQLDLGNFTTHATGREVCVDPNHPGYSPGFSLFLHIGGPVSSWEQCTGSFTSN
jgi:hypothetical protein